MSMLSSLHRSVILPAYERLWKRRSTMRYLSDLEASQWRSPQEVAALQFDLLVRLVSHAYESSPYYRSEWTRRGLHPRHLRSPTDFTRWPLLDRETIREHREALRSRAVSGPLIAKATGGSSGVPLQFDLDGPSHERRTAAAYRGYGWAGAGPGTRQLYLWGVPLGERSWRARCKDTLYNRLHRRRVVSCFDGDADLASRFADALDECRPDAIVAYVNPLYETARALDERGRRPRHVPGSIVVGAEKLHPFQRELIERVYRAPVFETYGSREFMLIGAECERHCGLHLTSEHLFVEILDDDGTPTPRGLEGNVVVTDLHNLGMPFVRYLTGDRAMAGFDRCACGRGLPLLSCVTGRRLDMLVASDGRVIPGEYFPHLVKDFPAVRRFQVIQESADLVRFRLAAERMDSGDRERLERLVRDALGAAMRIEFEEVESIELTAAGKLQVVINRTQLRAPVRRAA